MSILELISASREVDPQIAGPAARELLNRFDECILHIEALLINLECGNAGIEDLAFRTLERIGQPAGAAVNARLANATGRFRMYLISLLPIVTDFQTYFPLLKQELDAGEDDCRFHAANCLGRSFNQKCQWSLTAMETLRQSISLLQSARHEPLRGQYWSQARLTLKHLGLT